MQETWIELYCTACGALSAVELYGFIIQKGAEETIMCDHCGTRWMVKIEMTEVIEDE